MRILAILGGVIAVVLGGTAAYVASQPDTLHVERSRVIPVDAAVLYDQADDFTAWATWAPWEELDPHMTKTLSGPASGVGAGYAWEGNDQVGKGSMEILEADPGRRLHYALVFETPMQARQTSTLTFAPEGDGTRVTWAIDGGQDFMGKLFDVLMDFDRMIGADFEKGLAKLETVGRAEAERIAAEAAAAEAAARLAAAEAQADEPAPTEAASP